MPKVELHLHLEGAIPLPTLLNFIQKRGKNISIMNLEDLKKRLTFSNFTQFIKVWLWKNSFITEYEDFEELSYQVLKSLSEQNVKYAEVFYSPRDFTFRNKRLSAAGITESLIKGKERAFDDFGIRSELIVDIVRDYGPRLGLNLVKELTGYLGQGLIGISRINCSSLLKCSIILLRIRSLPFNLPQFRLSQTKIMPNFMNNHSSNRLFYLFFIPAANLNRLFKDNNLIG